MGIATGEAELRDDEFFGTVLNRTARVMSAGHGGQILVDGATAALISGVDLIELGPKRLRDITKPVEVYQIRAPGLRTEFPALRTVDSLPGNLRPPTTSFVGRAAEVAEVETALKAHRMVTLTGVGGVGKTRLALEVATRVVSHFTDGVFVIELAPVGDPSAVPEAVAATLGITQQPEQNTSESVGAALDGRSRLLVFDNCEHVLDAAADMIEVIFAHSTTVKILATSREGLRLNDEQLWPVPALDLQAGADSAAATLFMDRAQTVSPNVSMAAPDEANALVEICRRLDGIPLAIELAASRMVSMTAGEIRDRLDDRFRLLVGSRRGLGRHQTLHHTVQWSYDLLDDTEKAVLARCSVFSGGFDLAGACAVAESADDLVTLDVLDALVHKSLLVADRLAGHTRFSMLETIRQFAEEQLVASGDADTSRTAHARYFAGREADIMTLWDGPRQREAYEWFTVELANLRAAFRWAADHNDLDTAAAIAVYATFLGYWVQQYEASTWAEDLIEPAMANGHRRLAQLYTMAAVCYMTGRIQDFLNYADAGQRAIETGRFDAVRIELDACLGGGFLTTVGPDQCDEWARRLIARDPERSTYVTANLVFALEFAGNHKDALVVSTELLAAVETCANPTVLASALLAYGHTHRSADPTDAASAFRRGLAIAQANGDRQMESVHAMNLASLSVVHAAPVDALEFSGLAIRTYFDSGSLAYVSGPLGILAALFDRLGDYEPAAVISAFADTPVSHATYPEIVTAIAHLREVLGDETYESFARVGANMTTAAKGHLRTRPD